MASRYRVSVEREVCRSKISHNRGRGSFTEYEPSPKVDNRSPSLSRDQIDSAEFLHNRLRHKAQVEHKLRESVRDLSTSVRVWKDKYNGKTDQCDYLKEELNRVRKRHTEEVAELQRELRWNRKKIKALELVIEDKHNFRSPRTVDVAEPNQRLENANDLLIQENMRLSEQIMNLTQSQEAHAIQYEQVTNQLQQMKHERDEDLINIQNLENAVKALHDENVLLKEIPVPVILPKGQPSQRKLGQNMYQYATSRPTRPCVSLIDQRAQARCHDEAMPISNPIPQERWPYSSSVEDLSEWQ